MSSCELVSEMMQPKKFEGGYRHKKTGVEYHHASTQSVEQALVKPRTRNVSNLRHRESQTYVVKTRGTQAQREYGTQMKRQDLDVVEDERILCAKKYFTAAEFLELHKRKTLVLQCHWRGYKAREATWRKRQRVYERRRAEAEEEELRKAVERRREDFEIERRLNPKSKKDFELLYNELDAWREKEVEKSSHAEVLAKETKALQTIDRLKARAATAHKAKRVDTILQLMAQPKKWQSSSGETREVATAFTTRAAELKDLYGALILKKQHVDDRLEVLTNVEVTVEEFDCPLSQAIVDLCDREADLLTRNRPTKHLTGLRQRIANLVRSGSSFFFDLLFWRSSYNSSRPPPSTPKPRASSKYKTMATNPTTTSYKLSNHLSIFASFVGGRLSFNVVISSFAQRTGGVAVATLSPPFATRSPSSSFILNNLLEESKIIHHDVAPFSLNFRLPFSNYHLKLQLPIVVAVDLSLEEHQKERYVINKALLKSFCSSHCLRG